MLPSTSQTLNKKKHFKDTIPEKCTMTQEQLDDKLLRARIKIINSQPFFGVLAPRLKNVRNDDLPTACTDGKHFKYNGAFIQSLTQEETAWVYIHEILHVAFEHPFTVGNRTARWMMVGENGEPMIVPVANVAMDFVINLIIKQNGIGGQPSGVLYDEKWKNMPWQEVYDKLIEEGEKNSDSRQVWTDGLIDQHINADTDPDITDYDKEQIQKEIRSAVQGALMSVGAGDTPLGIEQIIQQLESPKASWKSILNQYLMSTINADYTFSRPSKKSMTTPFYLPSQIKGEKLEIAIGVDASGSCFHWVSDFLSEVYGIMSNFDDYIITLWTYDARCYNIREFTPDNAYQLKEYEVRGGGGTSFEENYRFMEKNNIKPKIFLNFTDGYPCGTWGDPNFCDTIFCIKGNRTINAPFGRTIHID